ncbi:SGT1-like protein [Auxenochlorella protothecoides]|uniref:SGT1-like protein n=1 Tax=Auxenochlorella protothecoides TaxID=3075 RepID=A0A087SJQ3_AUXPR|nr:SGT1-like protein [Auxenochlorella protothecoides]KFM25957.1 SGT1-like protein [Auxenochlorella protothecoides]
MDLRRALGLDSVAPEENTVHYELFPHTGTPHAFDVRGSVVYSLLVTSIASKAPLSCTDVDAPQLRALKTSCLESLLPWLSQHIWQRGRFDIQSSAERAVPLWGSVCFADNVEDEWCVVWLLTQITQSFPLDVRVWDNDGEFLLIEAAHSLPRGLKPEIADNRVWISGGRFHIVPTHLLPGSINLEQVEAFYYRDLDDAKAAGRPVHFPPRDLRTTAVTFSRCLYAQLALQEFPGMAGFEVPLPSDPKFPAASLGAKLAAGLEMLVAQRAQHAYDACASSSMSDADCSLVATWDDSSPAGYLAVNEALRDPGLAAYVLTQHQKLEEDPEPSSQANTELPPEGSLIWLKAGEAELEARLAARQAELAGSSRQADGDWDPSLLAARLNDFVTGGAGLEGAEIPPPRRQEGASPGPRAPELGAHAFLAELRSALGMEAGTGAGQGRSASSSEASSFYEGSASDECEGDQGPAGWGAHAVDTDTDSDDFEGAYDAALQAELAASAAPAAGDAGGSGGEAGGPATAPLAAPDLDAELVRNLLASVGMQEGTAGPGSNLAALLGVKLPDPRSLR